MKLPTSVTQQRVGFFATGLLFSLAAFYVGFRWPEIYEHIFREGFNYDSQPTWYRITGIIIGYLPLISIGVVAALRIAYKRAVRPVSYSVGVGAFYLGLFVLLIYAEAYSPF
jgi:hypothetical protein